MRISGCSVNSPWDAGICLKSSFALGEQRATENVDINDCYVTGGFALGTMLNRTFRRANANDGQPTGRIKCGTELSGGFENIVIGNCVFENCRGFALESVDGGPIRASAGTPLAKLAVKATNDVFVIELSTSDADVRRNIKLLKESQWFDIPIVYINGSRAIMAVEKGSPGDRDFSEAFAAWEKK